MASNLPEQIYVIGLVGRKALLFDPWTRCIEAFDTFTNAVNARYANCEDPAQFDIQERALSSFIKRGIKSIQINGCPVDQSELDLHVAEGCVVIQTDGKGD